MVEEDVTKKEIQVLYQISSDIFDPNRIADILPDLDIKQVKAAFASLRKKGLIRTEEGKLVVTEKGKQTLEKREKWAFG